MLNQFESFSFCCIYSWRWFSFDLAAVILAKMDDVANSVEKLDLVSKGELCCLNAHFSK